MSIETENPKLLPMITSFGLFFVGGVCGSFVYLQ
nr:MAG TPA: FAM176 family [Caudoviricetes sp.]